MYFRYQPYLSEPNLLVDTPGVYGRLQRIFAALYPTNPPFDLAEIDALIRRRSKFFAGERLWTPEEYLIRPVVNIKPKFKGGIFLGARSSS